MRCAVEKYYGRGFYNSELEAIKAFNDNFIQKFASSHLNYNEWRQENIHTPYLDNLVQAYMPFWTYLFENMEYILSRSRKGAPSVLPPTMPMNKREDKKAKKQGSDGEERMVTFDEFKSFI